MSHFSLSFICCVRRSEAALPAAWRSISLRSCWVWTGTARLCYPSGWERRCRLQDFPLLRSPRSRNTRSASSFSGDKKPEQNWKHKLTSLIKSNLRKGKMILIYSYNSLSFCLFVSGSKPTNGAWRRLWKSSLCSARACRGLDIRPF